jgi:hypothetical protein
VLRTRPVDSAVNNTTAGIYRSSETRYSILNAVYGTVFVQAATKNSFVKMPCRENLKYRIYSLYVTTTKLYTHNKS